MTTTEYPDIGGVPGISEVVDEDEWRWRSPAFRLAEKSRRRVRVAHHFDVENGKRTR